MTAIKTMLRHIASCLVLLCFAVGYVKGFTHSGSLVGIYQRQHTQNLRLKIHRRTSVELWHMQGSAGMQSSFSTNDSPTIQSEDHVSLPLRGSAGTSARSRISRPFLSALARRGLAVAAALGISVLSPPVPVSAIGRESVIEGTSSSTARLLESSDSNSDLTTAAKHQGGWQKETDPRTGRTFYVNHEKREWNWEPPVFKALTHEMHVQSGEEKGLEPVPHAMQSGEREGLLRIAVGVAGVAVAVGAAGMLSATAHQAHRAAAAEREHWRQPTPPAAAPKAPNLPPVPGNPPPLQNPHGVQAAAEAKAAAEATSSADAEAKAAAEYRVAAPAEKAEALAKVVLLANKATAQAKPQTQPPPIHPQTQCPPPAKLPFPTAKLQARAVNEKQWLNPPASVDTTTDTPPVVSHSISKPAAEAKAAAEAAAKAEAEAKAAAETAVTEKADAQAKVIVPTKADSQIESVRAEEAKKAAEYNSDAEGAAGAGHSYADACAAVDAAAKEAAVAGRSYADALASYARVASASAATSSVKVEAASTEYGAPVLLNADSTDAGNIQPQTQPPPIHPQTQCPPPAKLPFPTAKLQARAVNEKQWLNPPASVDTTTDTPPVVSATSEDRAMFETTVGPPTVYFISESEERLPSVYFISGSGEVTSLDAEAGQPEVYFVSEAGAVNEEDLATADTKVGLPKVYLMSESGEKVDAKAGQPVSGAVYFISDAGAVNEERLPSVYFISESLEVGKDAPTDAKAGQPAVFFISDAGAVNEKESLHPLASVSTTTDTPSVVKAMSEVMAKVDAKVGSSTVYFISEARPELHESKGDSDTDKDRPQMTGTQYSRNKKAWDV